MNDADLWESPIAQAYKLLFNAVTDTVEDLESNNIGLALTRLKTAQQKAESLIIND